MSEDKKTEVVKVESHSEVANVAPRKFNIAGLEDVPTNIIPVPFYKLVQPGSTSITQADGKESLAGSFYMKNKGRSVETLRFALLRAKRQVREFIGDNGAPTKTATMMLLGLNTDDMTPFILNVSTASFSNFGRLISQMKDKKVTSAWQYPIVATTEKIEQMKKTERGQQMVKFWTINFSLEEKPFSGEDLKMMAEAYAEFAGTLDRETVEEAQEKVAEEKFVENASEPF